MKIAILHLSDLHVKENDYFLREKVEKFLNSLNVLGVVDQYIIIFSGDLAFSGKIKEYKDSRCIIGKIISGLKTINGNKNIELFMVPGNHDLSLDDKSRTSESILQAYTNNNISSLVDEEIKLLDNFYTYSHARARVPYDKILSKRFCTYDNEYKIQFNLINTALFSTLKPDDKELHYFPKDKMALLKKQEEANLCITVMHHSCDWFNWNYQHDLEKAIINNSELLFTGHDHREKNKDISIDDSMNTWISCAGQMKFHDIDFEDSFNVISIDTDSNTFSGYIFNWIKSHNIYTHKTIVSNKPFQNRKNQLTALPSYLKEIKIDQSILSKNLNEDFTKYFVFPQLICDNKNEFGKKTKIVNQEEFINFLKTHKRIIISGGTNAGKTTLLKNLYCSVQADKVPLLLLVDSSTRIKLKNFIKRLFEDQYGEDIIQFERYQQLNKNKKIIIIDGWDRITNHQNKEQIIDFLTQNFEYVILSVNSFQKSIIGSVKDEINPEISFKELYIKPFFAEKRNQLVRNICTLDTSYNDEDITRVNKLIDSLVSNNYNLFSLDPAFIIRYTDYFIKDHTYDYTKGEAIFSVVFEHDIQSSIISFSKRTDVDEIITAFEELAGHIFKSRNDILKISDFQNIIDKYKNDYGVKISADIVLDVGIKSKLLKKTDNLSLYFSNKNYLSYFIAKYLFRVWQTDMDNSGIEYALQNICFGINADIILFISYLSSNTQTVMAIADHAGELLSPWEDLNFEKNNIKFLNMHKQHEISAPTEKDQKQSKNKQEKFEEDRYNEDTIEAKGLFDYDVDDIDKYPFRLIRAIKYTEMLCKALPAFNNTLKRDQKINIVNSIYSYPHKIVYAMLEPIDKNLEDLCKEILTYAEKVGATKKDGSLYNQDDIINMICAYAQTIILSVYDHFAELCTNAKTFDLLANTEAIGIAQELEKLIVYENSGDTDLFIKQADNMNKNVRDFATKNMVKRIARKHLISNPELPIRKRQQLIEKIFGKEAIKNLLLPANS